MFAFKEVWTRWENKVCDQVHKVECGKNQLVTNEKRRDSDSKEKQVNDNDNYYYPIEKATKCRCLMKILDTPSDSSGSYCNNNIYSSFYVTRRVWKRQQWSSSCQGNGSFVKRVVLQSLCHCRFSSILLFNGLSYASVLQLSWV